MLNVVGLEALKKFPLQNVTNLSYVKERKKKIFRNSKEKWASCLNGDFYYVQGKHFITNQESQWQYWVLPSADMPCEWMYSFTGQQVLF